MFPLENFDLRCSETPFPSFWGHDDLFSRYLQTTLSVFCSMLGGFEQRRVGIFSYQTENHDMAIPFSNNFTKKARSRK